MSFRNAAVTFVAFSIIAIVLSCRHEEGGSRGLHGTDEAESVQAIRPAVAWGQVTRAGGSAVPNAVVEMMVPHDLGGLILLTKVRSNGEGRYELPIPEGARMICLRASATFGASLKTECWRIGPLDNRVDLVIYEFGGVRGRLKGVLRGAEISVAPVAGWSRKIEASGIAGEDGRFEFLGLPLGYYRLIVTDASGVSVGMINPFAIEPGVIVAPLELQECDYFQNPPNYWQLYAW